MADPRILVKREYTRQEIADSTAAPVGPPSGQLAGSHILDLAALGKMIVLCDFCNQKFVPRGVNYVKWSKQGPVSGHCDGCKQYSWYAHGFIPDTLESAVGIYGLGPRPKTRGRWSKT